MNDRERLARITATTRAHTLRVRTDRSCIASTRILVDVLAYFGYASEPLACTALAFNPDGWEWANKGVPVDQWPDEAHSIGVVGTGTFNTEANRWDGHLVAIVEDHWLVDPSLDQMSRPEKGIDVGPIVLDITGWTDRSSACHWRRPDGLVLAYQPMAKEGPWRQAPDWSGKSNLRLFRQAIGGAIRDLKVEIRPKVTDQGIVFAHRGEA